MECYIETDKIDARKTAYPQSASRILASWQQGSSSASGEHQKFLACTQDKGHVIVKFSPVGNSPEAQRWQDLLICEYHALNCMNQTEQHPAAETILYQFENRIFIESVRFDRAGITGCIPMTSLTAIDSEFVAQGGSWTKVSQQLLAQKLISKDDQQQLVWNDLYGQWIGNNDRHLGNLSMQTTATDFKLLPAYDMLPMIYNRSGVKLLSVI